MARSSASGVPPGQRTSPASTERAVDGKRIHLSRACGAGQYIPAPQHLDAFEHRPPGAHRVAARDRGCKGIQAPHQRGRHQRLRRDHRRLPDPRRSRGRVTAAVIIEPADRPSVWSVWHPRGGLGDATRGVRGLVFRDARRGGRNTWPTFDGCGLTASARSAGRRAGISPRWRADTEPSVRNHAVSETR
jgi:hypothetical protein